VLHLDPQLARITTYAGFAPLGYRRPFRTFPSRSRDFVENGSRGRAPAGPVEGMLMTHAHPDCSDDCVVPPPEVITALKNLYIVSSALAQRGAYSQDIRDSQWRTMAQRAKEAKTALDEHGEGPEARAIVLLRQMTKACLGLIDRHAAHQEIPFTAWREVGRLGHDAYEWVNLNAPRRQGTDAGSTRQSCRCTVSGSNRVGSRNVPA
jgi:hypothetical protein